MLKPKHLLDRHVTILNISLNMGQAKKDNVILPNSNVAKQTGGCNYLLPWSMTVINLAISYVSHLILLTYEQYHISSAVLMRRGF